MTICKGPDKMTDKPEAQEPQMPILGSQYVIL